MRPNNKKRELANWIRRKLGAPVVNITVDPLQIDDAIDQACDMFGEHAGGVGNEDTLVAVCPQLVFYDGTGTICQPGPNKGRWRKFVSTPSTSGMESLGTSGTSGTSGCPLPQDLLYFKFGGPDRNPLTSYPVLDASGNPCPMETLPGPGWCGNGIQDAHCFIETEPSDPDAIGPFWVEGDTTLKPKQKGFVWKTIYDIPSEIIAVHDNVSTLGFGAAGMSEDNALFSPYYMMFQGGGSWGMQNSMSQTDSRWGYWNNTAGGGNVDMVSWYLGYQAIETYRQMFSTRMVAQLMELEHKVRLMPPPSSSGTIVFGATRRVRDENMYSHQWVREYAQALTMITIGMNLSKYGNLTMPNGGSINGELYLQRGDALREKLEAQLLNDRMYAEPPDFFVG